MCSADRLGMGKSTGPRFETPKRGIELNRLMVIERTEMIQVSSKDTERNKISESGDFAQA